MAIDREQTKAAIYRALEGEPEEFKATVFEIAFENKWNPNDPAFLLLAATGQLRALLRLHPAKIEAAMNQALVEAKQQWELWHSQTRSLATDVELTAQQVTQQLAAVAQLMQAEREEMMAMMAAERAALAQQMQEMAAQQKQVLEAKTNELITLSVAKSQQRTAAQVKEIIESVKRTHFLQARAWTWASAIGLICFSWFMFAQADRLSAWGRFEQWNQDELKACRAVDRTTCNIHIEPP